MKHLMTILLFCALNLTLMPRLQAKHLQLLHVSYDPTRELFQEINANFSKSWQRKSGESESITIRQSHGGSAKQARAVRDGLAADIVSLALAYDVEALAAAGLLPHSWRQRLASGSSPFSSTIVFLVRKGNPKQIRDWNDLVLPGRTVITPNPKTSGGARWNYLAAWGWALQQPRGTEESAEAFVRQLYRNVKVLDAGARASTTTFAQRGIGDALITWENEAYLALQEFGADRFEIVLPSRSIRAEPVVALVDRVVEQKGSRVAAQAYLDHLYEEETQAIIARHHFRPRSATALQASGRSFPSLALFTVEELFGDWQKAHARHFADGGSFDRIFRPSS